MHGLGQELRYAARRLLRSPAFTLAAVLTLALAIGANASIFAVVQRVVLNPLPYPDSDRLIELDHGSHGLNMPANLGLTAGLYLQYAERARTLEGAAIFRTDELTLTGDGDPERVRCTRATPSLAAVLRVSPAVGRWFTDAEGRPGAAQVAVLSHGLWTRRYGANPRIVGTPVMLGGVPTEVVGVMAPSFAFPDPRVDLWLAEPLARSMGFGLWNYTGVARLRAGAMLADARAELNSLIADVPKAFPGDQMALGNVETRLFFAGRTLKEATLGTVALGLWILLAAVGVVLMVACANVANLFLVRSDARQREIAVRRALGASSGSIARYFLTESILLSIAGGAIGLLIASFAVRLLVISGPATLPRLHEIRLDAVVAVFTCALSVVAAFAFGAIPLWRGAGQTAALHDMGRGNTASRSRHRARHVLMGAQVALALVLLVSSALMVRSFQKLRALDPNFDPASALSFSIGLPERQYPTREAAVAAHHAVLDRLSTLPGVVATTASTCLPLTGGCSGNTILVEGRPLPRGATPPIAMFRAVAGGYFEVIGMRMLRGRSLTRADVDHLEPVIVVNQALAERIFPGQDPIGQRIASNRPPPGPGQLPDLTWLTIVGVVANTALRTPAEANPAPQLFMPMSLATGPGVQRLRRLGPDVAVMSYVVRSRTPPLGLLPSVRRAVDTVDKDLALARVQTLQASLDRASAQMAFTMVLLAIAAAVTLMLGLVGIYGVMSYIVSQRTGEIGVRLALGAEPRDVAGMIVRQGGVVALAGAGVGLAAALAGSRVIESLLYGVSPRDPVVFGVTTIVLLAVALAACWLPARRAARLSPLDALRET
jgi:putative ABC transport system permease protein